MLGSAIAKGYASAGAKVGLLTRNKQQICELENELAKFTEVISLEADVLVEASLKVAKSEFINRFGSIDILVNAAGGNLPGANILPEDSFFDVDINRIKEVVDLNLHGTILSCKVFGKPIADKQGGCIINVSSMASFRPLTRVAGYSAAKAGVDNFTKWLAVEMAMKYGSGIRVNAIAPGFFVTSQNRALLTHPDGKPTERGRKVLTNTPFGRFGEPEDLLGTMLWLSSDASRFVTGTVIPVDGGFNAYAGV